MDLTYLATMDDFDPIKFTEAAAPTLTNFYIAMVVVTVPVKQQQWKALFAELYSFGSSGDAMACRQLKANAKWVRKLSIVITTIYGLAVGAYMAIPALKRHVLQTLNPNETYPPLLTFRMWFPYDVTQSPGYKVAFFIEFVRLIDLSLAIGIDIICLGIMVYIVGQFRVLCRSFLNIRQTAVERLTFTTSKVAVQLEEDVDLEIEKLFRDYVKKHKKLIR